MCMYVSVIVYIVCERVSMSAICVDEKLGKTVMMHISPLSLSPSSLSLISIFSWLE